MVVVLVALGGFQAIQLFAVRTGHATDLGYGPRLSLFLYFPTILTTYVVLALAQRRGIHLRNLGFVRPASWRPALHALAAAMVAGPAYGAVLFMIGGIQPPALPDFLAVMIPAVPVVAVASWALPIVTTVPLLEEIIFRGVLYRGLRSRLALMPALLLTGLVFAAFHMDIARIVPLAIAGAAFAYAYERSGSILPAIAAHAGLNFVWVAVVLVRPMLHG